MVNTNDDSIQYEDLIKGCSLLLVIIGAIGAMWTVNGQIIDGVFETSLLVAPPVLLVTLFVTIAVIGLIGVGYSEGVLQERLKKFRS